MAQVFPFIQLGYTKKIRIISGMLMRALRKSITERFAKKMFGKVRRFLNLAKMAKKEPLPIVATNPIFAPRTDTTTISVVLGSILPTFGSLRCS